MYPNFRKIKGLVDSPFLRVAMYTAQGEDLKRLQAAYPECYSGDVNDLCVPASVLRDLAERNSGGEGNDAKTIAQDREAWWAWPLEELGAPIAFSWHGGEPIPEEVLSQLRGRPFVGGMTVEYLGERFLLGFLCADGNNGLGKPLVLDDNVSIVLVHAKFIDFDH